MFCDLRDPSRLLDWLAAGPGRPPAVCVWTFSSSAARLAVAARERGQRLDGVIAIVQGEPFTEARRRAVEAVGARAVVRYGSMEAPTIGLSCAEERAPDDLHLMTDRYAMVRRAREVAGSRVHALLFTALSPSAPRILLNVETGDHARVDERACGCGLGALGQLVEEETVGGATRLVLLASPALGALDPATVRAVFLDALGGDGAVARYMADVWRRAETVELRREAPRATQGGKVLPFHLARLDHGTAGAGPPA